VTVRLPERVPVAVGAKLTPIVQVAPTAKVGPHEFTWEKSPLAVMLEMSSVAVPTLLRVTD
jgi:hypothetical protein